MSDPIPNNAPPLPIEETPEIIVQPQQALPPVGMLPKKKSGSFMKTLGMIILFLGLFVVGIWLSSFVRQFQPSDTTSRQPTKTPTPTKIAKAVNPSDPFGGWKTYDVISGVTRKPVAGVQFKLPSDVLSPICDGSGCASQGTYLPGGTRFTVAPRGTGQSLRDFRGTVISDVNGKPFETKMTTIAGKPAKEFSASFAGRTISGYVFSKMRGVMIELSDTTSLEVNHFTPNGIVSDFEKDDVLFNSILKTIVISSGNEKGSVATSSGY